MTTETQNKKVVGARVPALRFSEFSGEWEEKRLGELFNGMRSGANFSPSEMLGKSGIKIITKKSVSSGGVLRVQNLTTYLSSDCLKEKYKNCFVDESFTITTLRDLVPSGPSIGYMVKLDTPGYYILAQGVYAFEVQDNCNDQFLLQYSNRLGYRREMQKIKVGSTQVHITTREFKKVRVLLPSILEQQKIAGALGVVDEKIEGLTKKKKSLERYKKGVMQKIFAQEIRFKPARTTQLGGDENGNSYPDWEEKKLGEVLKIGSGRDHKHLKPGDVPVFGTGGYMFSVDKNLGSGETVFIGRKGTINKPFYYNGDFWTVDTLFYTYGFDGITPKFTNILFQQINWLKYNEASGVPSLSKNTIERIKIKIPSVMEQQKIAEFLASLDEKISAIGNELSHAKEFKKGLLQQMFV